LNRPNHFQNRTAAENAGERSQKIDRSERRDRSLIRRALSRGVPSQAIQIRLLATTEFHRLNPERDPIAYVRGLIDEEGSTLRTAELAKGSPGASVAESGSLRSGANEPAVQSELLARRYIQENFEKDDWLAVVIRNHADGHTIQKITTAQQIASPEFQAWLRHKNAHGSDIYLSLNPLKDHARTRTKSDIKEIRHLYLDLDQKGRQKLAAIYQNPTTPPPNYVLQTSPEKYQVIWRVENIPPTDAEQLLRALAQRFGGDTAATDVTRVFRIPGFNNKKYKQDFSVKLTPGTSPYPIYHGEDFKIEVVAAVSGSIARANVVASTELHRQIGNTQSERDWSYAIRRLRQGDSPQEVARAIAAYRATERRDHQDPTKLFAAKKPNPRYYAEHTVDRAMAHLGIAGSSNEQRQERSETKSIEPSWLAGVNRAK
jgi:DNA primase RepB-like protein